MTATFVLTILGEKHRHTMTILSFLLAVSLLLPGPTTAFTFQTNAPPFSSAPSNRKFSNQRRPLSLSKTPTIDNHVETVSSMPPPLPPQLRNQYYLLRHGQSTANVAGIISSDRGLATSSKHGLTPLGYEQGRDSSKNFLDMIETDASSSEEGSKKRVFFYSSPFARAKGTAEACLDGLREDLNEDVERLGLDIKDDVVIDYGLMERYFGRLDGEKLNTYAYVWPVDLFDSTHTAFGVESVAAVSTRIRKTILDIDESSEHRDGEDIIVLVSHADVLQITQLYAAGKKNVGEFSQYRFGNGEVRAMARTVDSLPEACPMTPPKRGT